MAGTRCLVFVVLMFPWTLTRVDTDVSCVFMESCILPCSFQTSTDLVVHWVKTPEYPVHSYYFNQDQLTHQHQSFRGRTSLFQDQISRGNASLLLTGVQLQDQGRYKCYTSTITGNKEIFVYLKVEAPVTKVHLEQEENRLSCSSEGIYPEPELTWSTEPPSSRTFNTTTTVQQTEQLLYNISSSLLLSPEDPDVVYICTVSSGTDRRRATLLKPTNISVSHTEATIPCSDSHTPFSGLIWRFNHRQTIWTQTGADVQATGEWRQRVKSVSRSGSLTLQQLSSEQEGIYTCELSRDEDTVMRSSQLSLLNTQEDNPKRNHLIIGLTILAAVAVFILIWPLYKCRGGQGQNPGTKPVGTADTPELATNIENSGESIPMAERSPSDEEE